VLQDLRFTFRLMAKDRWYTAVAVLALALGIGVNATVFTIINAAFLRGLPVQDSSRIYALSWQARRGGRVDVSSPEFHDWRAASRTLELAAFTEGTMNIADDRTWPEQARGAWLSADAFRVLRQPPLLGRDFAPTDDHKGAEPVVMLGHRLWMKRYGGDPNVLGAPVRVNGQPATIVGVMPAGMEFPISAELWMPFVPSAADEDRSTRSLSPFGRLRDGVSLKQAQAEMSAIAQQLAAAYPDASKEFAGIRIETFTQRFVGGAARPVFLSMMGAVVFVLLIACANVANLLLSRSAHRAREIAVRMALGATRGRVLRQLLLESVVLGVLGGGAGLLIAMNAISIFDAAVQDPEKPYWMVFAMDYTVFAYVAGICLATGILVGIAPALHVSKNSPGDVMKEGGRGVTRGHRARWFSGTMVVVELALTMVLLVGAGLMIRNFLKLYSLDIGIQTDRLMTMRLQLPAAKYAAADTRRAFFDQLEPRLMAIPGIDAVALATVVPPFASGQRSFEIEGQPQSNPDTAPRVSTVTISPGFFGTVGVPLVRGRLFTERDGAAGSEAAIINERMASQFFPGEDPLGKRVRFVGRDPQPQQSAVTWHTIVGVSPSIRHGSFEDASSNPVLYLPFRQNPASSVSVIVRSQLPVASVSDAVRRAVTGLDQDQPVFTVQTLDQMVAASRWPFRVFGNMFVVFGFVALVLATVGLYAVMAYSVTQRTQEIAVRMALGAAARQVSWLILKRGLVQLAIGLVLGVTGAFALSGALRRILVQVSSTDPVTFVGITVLMIVVSVAACLLPAYRATRLDPLVALRAE
jgi:predicted permease